MRIAQISDFHVTRRGTLVYGRVDTVRALEAAVAAIMGLKPQPNLVLGTGDLTQSGDPGEYAVLREILYPLEDRFLPLIGNHDNRTAFRAVYPEFCPDSFVQYAREQNGIRVIAMDTVREGSDHPDYCAKRLLWLEETLAQSTAPTVLALHYPPIATGIPWLEPGNPDWADPITETIRCSGAHVIKIVAGHVHRNMQAVWRGISLSTCPSTAHQVALDFTSRTPSLALEAPGFLLHDIEDRSVTTYAAAIPGLHDTFNVAPGTLP